MDRELDQINVIPLVDVMLVLLVIVLTTATFISTGQIPVDLAKAKEAGDRHDTPVVVTIAADGRVFVNDQPTPEAALHTALAAFPKASLVVVRADRTTVLERFVQIMDGIRGQGFQQVSLEVIRS
jgi:biopolymer transport protein ExbD